MFVLDNFLEMLRNILYVIIIKAEENDTEYIIKISKRIISNINYIKKGYTE